MSLEKGNNEEIDTSNIFEEFDSDSDLKKEVKNIVESQNKDLFYYLSLIWSLMQTVFWLLLIAFALLYSYIFIQESDIKDNTVLDPFCIIFLWNIENNEDDKCSSIYSLYNTYETNLQTLKESHVKAIVSILEQLYKLENFTKSEEIVFLEYKTDSKLKVLTILEEFDMLKNKFEEVKDKIICYDIEINKDKIFKAKCDVYARHEEEIKWFNGTDSVSVTWTSISVANSFLNFIEKRSEVFTVLDRQKIFSSQSVIWETGFTDKTTFYLKLKYTPDNLSL
jgi:hypothetical protein